jgi:hypothetical protein
MKYTGTLTGNETFITLFVAIAFFAIILWFIPMIRWNIERRKLPILSLRAIVSFGQKYGIKMGGSFYRITAYEDFLIIVMWWPEVIKYHDIKKLKLVEGITSILSMTTNNVPIRIYGNIDKLKELQTFIKSQNKNNRGRKTISDVPQIPIKNDASI